MAEETKEISKIDDDKTDVKIENAMADNAVGPKVLSKINLTDNQNLKPGFEIKVGEIKDLPADYEKSPLIVSCLKKKDLELMTTVKKNAVGNGKLPNNTDATLDNKDVSNFLNQNTATVIKQLKINELSKKDLNLLLIAEKRGKTRRDIIVFIKNLIKVI